VTSGVSSVDSKPELGEEIREEFPLLAKNPELAYLDNAATSQKPEAVLGAMDRYYREENANVNRSLYELAEKSTLALEDSRRTVGEYLNAISPREIVFTKGSTEGLNLCAWGLGELLLGPGDIVLASVLEHHSNLVPWQQAVRRAGAELVVIPADGDATLDMSFLETLEKDGRAERVRVVAVSHISNAFGTIHPVKSISAWCRRHDIAMVLDAAQSLPHLPIDVQATGADFLVFSGHKAYGPMGAGVLWGREEWLEKIPPWQTGGGMISTVRLEHSTWNEPPFKFEAGTPNVAAIVGLATALNWISATGISRLEAREVRLGAYAYERLTSVGGLKLYGPADSSRRRGVFSFNLEGIHSHDVAQYLSKADQIAIRSGHHCAQPAMRFLGIQSTARASLAPYNTIHELNRLVDAIIGAREYFC